MRDDQTPAQPSNSLHTSPRKSHKKKKKNDGDDAAERFSAMADLSNSEPDTVRNQFMGCLGLRAADVGLIITFLVYRFPGRVIKIDTPVASRPVYFYGFSVEQTLSGQFVCLYA